MCVSMGCVCTSKCVNECVCGHECEHVGVSVSVVWLQQACPINPTLQATPGTGIPRGSAEYHCGQLGASQGRPPPCRPTLVGEEIVLADLFPAGCHVASRGTSYKGNGFAQPETAQGKWGGVITWREDFQASHSGHSHTSCPAARGVCLSPGKAGRTVRENLAGTCLRGSVG